jgi:hypothetical protein
VTDGLAGIDEARMRAWGLDPNDNPNSRERHSATNGKAKAATEVASFRCSLSHLRALDEIIQSGIDPRLKTKSDCLQDAVSLFLEDWTNHYADGVSGRTLRRLRLERVQAVLDSRQTFLDLLDKGIDTAREQKDLLELRNLLHDARAEATDSEGYAPQTYIDEVNRRVTRLSEMLEEEHVR